MRRRIIKPSADRLFRGHRPMFAFLTVVFLLVVTAAAGAHRAAAQTVNTDLRCEPLNVSGLITEQITVDFYVEDVVDFFGLQSRISFDPAYVQAVDQDPNWPGVNILPLNDFAAPGFIVERNADNVSGTIAYSMTRLDPQPPVTGSGAIARVVFQPQQEGTFTMVWDDDYVLLSAPAGEPIASNNIDCTVTIISDPTAVTLQQTHAPSAAARHAAAGLTLFVALALVTLAVGRTARRHSR